ncbi:hypothetical protein E4T56_gene2112 [Termitomyces sp. T112]|nr:hypothetical protein E4T56_gene2112 [Termitomyces sp. T112]
MGRNQSVYGDRQSQRSWLTRALSPVLFLAPEVHLKSLENIWVDGIAWHILWKAHISKLNSEWQEFTLYATVILNANVAFLAIQSVDSSSPGNGRSSAQIATSIGSIILGLLLVRQNKNREFRDAADISRFLHRRGNQALGLESLALMYSLPYGLLMWGMICFLVAFLFDGSDVYTRSLVGATCGFITFLVVCGIWMALDGIPGIPMLNQNSRVGTEEEAQEKAAEEGEMAHDSKDLKNEKGGPKNPNFPWKWQTIFCRDAGDSV